MKAVVTTADADGLMLYTSFQGDVLFRHAVLMFNHDVFSSKVDPDACNGGVRCCVEQQP